MKKSTYGFIAFALALGVIYIANSSNPLSGQFSTEKVVLAQEKGECGKSCPTCPEGKTCDKQGMDAKRAEILKDGAAVSFAGALVCRHCKLKEKVEKCAPAFCYEDLCTVIYPESNGVLDALLKEAKENGGYCGKESKRFELKGTVKVKDGKYYLALAEYAPAPAVEGKCCGTCGGKAAGSCTGKKASAPKKGTCCPGIGN